jgi:hypothetical protein
MDPLSVVVWSNPMTARDAATVDLALDEREVMLRGVEVIPAPDNAPGNVRHCMLPSHG